MSTSLQQTRDSTSSEPNTFPIALRIFKNIDVYETVRINRNDVTTGFIVGNPTYGKINVTVFGSGTPIEIDHYVVNQNNIFVDLFDTDDFIDTTNSTGTFDNTNKAYDLYLNEIMYSTIIAANNTPITKAVLDYNTDAVVTAYLSADNGEHFEQVTNGIEHTFTYTGTVLKAKFTGSKPWD